MRKIALLILAISSAASIQAQDTTSFRFEFNHLTLIVKDVNRSIEFYKKVLLLDEIDNRAKENDMKWLSMGGIKELHLSSIGSENVVIDTSIHFALATNNFDGFIKRLQGRNIPFTDSDGHPGVFSKRADGVKQLYLQDPDGYWIEVNNIGGRSK